MEITERHLRELRRAESILMEMARNRVDIQSNDKLGVVRRILFYSEGLYRNSLSPIGTVEGRITHQECGCRVMQSHTCGREKVPA